MTVIFVTFVPTRVTLTAGGHPPNCQPRDEQRDQTVEQQGLPRMAIPYVRPNEWQDQHCSRPVQQVDGRCRTKTIRVEDRAKQSLSDDQDLSDDQRTGQTSPQYLTAEETPQSP